MADVQPSLPARSDPSKDRDVFIKNRLKFIDYVRRVHEEKTFWMNAVWVSRDDVKTYLTLTELVERARTYFDLGLNIGRLLSLVSGVAVLRATAQLLAEFDYYCSKDGSIQDLKLMVSRAKSGYYPDTLTDVPDSEPVRPVLHKHNGRIVYEYLTVLTIAPEHLDYFEVTIALCNTLAQFYQKFMDEACAVPHMLDALEAMDKKLRALVFKPMQTMLTDVAVWKLRAECGYVNDLLLDAALPAHVVPAPAPMIPGITSARRHPDTVATMGKTRAVIPPTAPRKSIYYSDRM